MWDAADERFGDVLVASPADVAALQDDVVGIDGNLTTAASVTVVENTVTEAIDDLDELGDLDF